MEHVTVHEDGIPEVAVYTPAIAIDAVGGKVVAYVGSDVDCYSEFFIDFVTDDGRVTQLACVGQRHNGDEHGMHASVWDGMHEDAKHEIEIEVSEKSRWYHFGKESTDHE